MHVSIERLSEELGNDGTLLVHSHLSKCKNQDEKKSYGKHGSILLA